MKSEVLKSSRHLHWLDKLYSKLFFFASENNHLLFLWPTIHFFYFDYQVHSSHFSEDDLLDGHWEKRNITLCNCIELRMTVKWFNCVLKICCKFQVLTVSLLTLMPWLMSIQRSMWESEEKILQLQSMSNAIICIDHWSKVWCQEFRSCLTSIFNLSNPKSKIQLEKSLFKFC